jgi:hypothetical protein
MMIIMIVDIELVTLSVEVFYLIVITENLVE